MAEISFIQQWFTNMDEKKEVNPSSQIELKPFIIVSYDLKNLAPVKKIEVSHKLYGHAQVKKGKRYEFGGIVKSMQGMKLGRGAIFLPQNCKEDIIRFLESYSIKYQIIPVLREA